MGKRLNRSKKLIAFFFVFVFALSVGMYSTSFDSKAANLEFYLDYPEPATDAFSGYITLLLCTKSTGEYSIVTYFWNTYVLNDPNALSAAYAYINLNSDSMNFTVGGNIAGQNMSAMYNLHGITSSGVYRMLAHSESSSWTMNFANAGYQVVGQHYSGNVCIDLDASLTWTPFSVFYGSSSTHSALNNILVYLASINNTEAVEYATVQSILNSIDNVEGQLDALISYLRSSLSDIDAELEQLLNVAEQILAEQKETNNWLQKIWQAIVDFFTPNQDDEDKKNELDEEYQSQVDDLEDLDEGLELDKPPPEEVEEEIEDNLDVVEDEDEEDLEEFKDILSLILNNEYIIEMLLIVLTLILIAFVFYGKR